MQVIAGIILGGMLVLLSGCTSTAVKEQQIQRISPEELERIMPQPAPHLTLDEIVQLSKEGASADQIIEKIKASQSRYDLAPSQAVELSKKGVDAKVLDYIYTAREQALRDGFADEINKREKARRDELERLQREYQWRYQPYYDPFWGYGWYSPYWGYPSYGFGYRHYRGW